MYNPSVAGSLQWDTFPRESLDDPPAPTVNGLPLKTSGIIVNAPDRSQKTNHYYNKYCQRCVFHEVLLLITRVTAHVLFKSKPSICIKLT